MHNGEVYIEKETCPRWLIIKEVLSYFGDKGKRRYREFIAEEMKSGTKTPWEEIRGQVLMWRVIYSGVIV